MNENRKPSAEIRWHLALTLRRLRDARGFTQEQLGQRCGLPHRYISNIEQERINIGLANLEALAIGLDCWEADLLLRNNGAPPYLQRCSLIHDHEPQTER